MSGGRSAASGASPPRRAPSNPWGLTAGVFHPPLLQTQVRVRSSTCARFSNHWPPCPRERSRFGSQAPAEVVPSPPRSRLPSPPPPAWAGSHYAPELGCVASHACLSLAAGESPQATPADPEESGPRVGVLLPARSGPRVRSGREASGCLPPSFITGAPACLGRGVLAGHDCPSPPRPDSPPFPLGSSGRGIRVLY